MMFLENPTTIIMLIPILIFSIALHESMHARVAYWLGDKSQLIQGRMTLYPLAHLDIMGFFSILLIGFGWGKPALIDDRYFKNKKRDLMLVSLAGPMSNLLLALVLTILLKVLFAFGLVGFFITNSFGNYIYSVISLAIVYNVMLAVFNLLPIPPFDGSKVVAFFMSYNMRQKYMELERYSFLIILVMLLTNLDVILISPVVDFVLNILNWILNI